VVLEPWLMPNQVTKSQHRVQGSDDDDDDEMMMMMVTPTTDLLQVPLKPRP